MYGGIVTSCNITHELWILHSYNESHEMHYFSHLFDKVLYMFRTGPLSIISSISTLYTQQYMLVLLASASRQPTEPA
jgi:hypothetical protein